MSVIVSGGKALNAGMPLEGRPSLMIGPSTSPFRSWLRNVFRTRPGAWSVPWACEPWQNEQFAEKKPLPRSTAAGSGGGPPRPCAPRLAAVRPARIIPLLHNRTLKNSGIVHFPQDREICPTSEPHPGVWILYMPCLEVCQGGADGRSRRSKTEHSSRQAE